MLQECIGHTKKTWEEALHTITSRAWYSLINNFWKWSIITDAHVLQYQTIFPSSGQNSIMGQPSSLYVHMCIVVDLWVLC